MWFTLSKDAKKIPAINKGAAAETVAERYLQQQGLITRNKNYRTKYGEIDLIMVHGQTLVFVEVRLRSNQRFTAAADTVDYKKQQKLIKTAQQFLLEQNLSDKVACRFDVVALSNMTFGTTQIEWFENAFGI